MHEQEKKLNLDGTSQERSIELDLGLDPEADRIKADEAYRHFAQLNARVLIMKTEMQTPRPRDTDSDFESELHDREVLAMASQYLEEARENAIHWEIRARAGEAGNQKRLTTS